SRLIQKRPEEVVVAFVDERYANGSASEGARRVQSAEAAAHYDDPRLCQSCLLFVRMSFISFSHFGSGANSAAFPRVRRSQFRQRLSLRVRREATSLGSPLQRCARAIRSRRNKTMRRLRLSC